MNLAALKEEIAKPEYSGKTDNEIAAAINTKTITRSRLLQTWEVRQHAIENFYWPAIVMAYEPSNTHQQSRAVAISAIDWINNQETIDLERPSVQTLLGGLQSFGLITAEQVASLMAMRMETVPFLQTIGVEQVGPHHISEAKNAK